MNLRSIRGLGGADLADVSARLAEQVEANMGMAMIYALVASAQDWLREKVPRHQDHACKLIACVTLRRATTVCMSKGPCGCLLLSERLSGCRKSQGVQRLMSPSKSSKRMACR